MKSIFRYASLLALSAVLFSCSPDDPAEPPSVGAPSTYTFENVNYSGQVIRILLLQDLETLIKVPNVTRAQLTSAFEDNNEVQGKYTELGTGKSLKGAFLASPTHKDTQTQTEWLQQINNWLDTVAAGKTTTDQGIDLTQAIPKVLMGAIFYDQATNKYFNMAVDPQYDQAQREHYFDEAFGYFGAARNYNEYTDQEIIDGVSAWKDFDGDGQIDTTSELNFKYYAATAAKRDKGSSGFTSGQTNYTNTLFTNFVNGRYAIVQQDAVARDLAIANIRNAWEEIIAATVVHYINDTKADLAADPVNTANLNKHWGEMKYYFATLSFNPNNKLGANYSTVDALLGENPSDTNAQDLDAAAAALKTTYGFTDEQISNWKLGF